MRAKLTVVGGRSARVMQKVSRSRNPAGRQTDKNYGRSEHKYLSPAQVDALIAAAKDGRHGRRDALMISLAYHHALRVTELIKLTWDAIDTKAGTIRIARSKNGVSGLQYLELGDRRALGAMRKAAKGDDFVFLSERGLPLTRDAFAKQLAAAGVRGGLDRRLCHPHALRHAAGHAMANGKRVNAYQLQAIMGHKDGRSTSIYVQGVAGLIRGVWD
jgi:type 1 fimbriae regulatory protein FimB/type 1 fimbriae regulatory protein FimE